MAENMLNNLNREAEKAGLKIHSGKTQWMSNKLVEGEDLRLVGRRLGRVEEY